MTRLGVLAFVVLLASCASQAGDPGGAGAGAAAAGELRGERVDASMPVARDGLPRPGANVEGLGPSILVPRTPAEDEVVAVVGDVTIRKSHLYDRMLENDRRGARVWVDLLVMDCVVAEQARRHEIAVTSEEIDRLVQEESELLRAQVQAEWGDRLSFPRYLERQFGLTEDEYRTFVTLDLARMRYRSYVIRYLAIREDRAEVRFIVHRDPEVLADLRQKVLAGADFATLARRWSEDESRRDGGLLAPFGRAFRHPIATTAFELEPGQISEVVPFEGADGTRQAIVYCLRRMPARDLPFAEVRSEIAAELERRPVTPFEQNAFTLQYCVATAPLSGPPEELR